MVKYVATIVKLFVVIVHVYPSVTGQRQALTIGRSAHFSLQLLLCAWRNLTCLGVSSDPMFLWISSKFFSTDFGACSQPSNRDNDRKASYPRTQQPGQVLDEPRSCN